PAPRSASLDAADPPEVAPVLDGFLHFAGLEAPGADVGALGDAVDQDAHLLEVRVEPAARGHHRMAPVVAERRLLAAGCADLGHRPRSVAAPSSQSAHRSWLR